MIQRVFLFLALLGTFLAGCTSPGSGAVSPEPDPSASTIVSSHQAAALGEPFTVTVQLRDADGNPLRLAGRKVTFVTSSGDLSPAALDAAGGSSATVETDEEGRASVTLTPASAGTVTIRAFLDEGTAGAAFKTVSVTVAPTAVELDDQSFIYDGTPKTVTPRFYPPEASESATIVYARDGVALDAPPSDAGEYVVTVTAGDGYEGTVSATLMIEPRALTVEDVNWANKTYDGTTKATASDATLKGDIVDGDDVRLAGALEGVFASDSAGAHAVEGRFALAGEQGSNYRIDPQPKDEATITRANVTLTGGAVATKYYDGTTKADITGTLTGDLVEGDDVMVVGTLATADVGTDIEVVVALAGKGAGNYALKPIMLKGNIEPQPLVTLKDGTVTYDGTSQALMVEFAPAGAGEGATITYEDASGTSSTEPPTDVGTYTVTATAGPGYTGSATATLVIEPVALSVTNVEFGDKEYDAATGATLSATLVTTNIVAGDDVRLVERLVGTFASSQVGVHDVVGNVELTGADAGNYVVHPQPTGSAEITLRAVTLTFADVNDKPYDANDVANVTGSLSGVRAADLSDIGFEAAFPQAAAGADLPVAVTLTGDAAANYRLADPALIASITPRPVTITIADLADKPYGDALVLGSTDGFTIENFAAGESIDQITISSDGAAADATVGTYEVTGMDASGAGFVPDNYAVTYVPGKLAVTKRAITVTAATTIWTYGDGPVDGDLAPRDATDALPDFASLAGTLLRTDANAGEAIPFKAGTLDIVDGDGASLVDNLDVTLGTYTVTPRPAAVTASYDVTKTYGHAIDLTTVGTESFTATGLAAGEMIDTVAITSDGFPAGAAASDTPYPVILSDPTGTNFDASNYDLTVVPGSVTIQPRTLTIAGSFTVAERAYDGTTSAPIADASGLTLVDAVDGDDVTLGPVAAYADALVGEGKTATLTDASSLTGTAATNYALSLDGAPISTGTIVRADIAFDVTIAGTNGAKTVVYDGGTTFQPNVTTSLAPIPADQPVAFTVDIRYLETGESRGSFRDVGQYQVTVTADDARYQGRSVIDDLYVLARQIVIAPSATAKTYGDANPELLPAVDPDGPHGLGAGDAFAGGELAYAGSAETNLAAGAYPFDLGAVTIERDGQDVTSNYHVTFTADFTIQPRTLTITPDEGQIKTYGDTDPELFTYKVTGFATGDDASLLTGALARTAGEDVGTYPYALGTLHAGANYALTFPAEPAAFEVTLRPIVLTAATTDVTYGDAARDLTAMLDSGSSLRDGDVLSGALAMGTTDAGTWTFDMGDAILTRGEVDVAANYAVTIGEYSVQPRAAVIVPDADQAKTYGDADPAFTYTVQNLVKDDTFTGTLGRDAGEAVGTYAFTLGDLANPNYAPALTEEVATFAITPRALTLGATVSTKQYSDDDPDLTPVLLADTTLRDGDALVGSLVHTGEDVGTYDLTQGSVQILRDGTLDVTANYALSFGTIIIEPKPVTFDIVNSDATIVDGATSAHMFFGDGASAIRGLEVVSTPAGMTSFRFSYRRTHDENHAPVPDGMQSVQNINLLGSYVVTVTATDDNYVGATPLDVWVTDATHVAFTAASPSEVMVGDTAMLTAELRNDAGEARHAGTVGLPINLASSGAEISFRDAQSGTEVTTAEFAPGAVSVDVTVSANALTEVPVDLTATAVTDPVGVLTAAATSVTPTAALALADDWSWEVPVGIESPTITVGLIDANGDAVVVPAGGSSLAVSLAASPDDVTFNVGGAQATEASIAPGSSTATLTLSSAVPGSTTVTASHAGTYLGVQEANATVLITELTATDDGPISVVGGGDITLSIKDDLLTNDVWTGSTGLSFDGIMSESIVTTQVSGDVLIVSAPSDAGGSSGSFTYQIRDDVYGTTDTATVQVDVTYPPTDAILFTHQAEFDDFTSTRYEPPTFDTIVNEWPRFDGGSYYASGSDAPVGSNAAAWTLDGGNVYQPNNASPPTGFVSPDEFEYYTFEATLASRDMDNDSIGLVLAYDENGAGSPRYLVAVRGQNQTGSLAPNTGWGLWYYDGGYRTVIVEPDAGLTGHAGWGDGTNELHYTRVSVTRTGDNLTLRTTNFQGDANFLESDYVAASEITVDLTTGDVQQGGLQSTHAELKNLSGAQSYGYWSYSQPYTTFLDVNFEGGADLETAILLKTPTTIDGTDAWSGSEVWRFSNDTWTQDINATIQSALGYPRNVTSIAEPNPGSAYATYSVYGREFRIQENEVLLLNQ